MVSAGSNKIMNAVRPPETPWLHEKMAQAMAEPAVRAWLDAWGPRHLMTFDFGDGKRGSLADRTCDKCGGYYADGLWLGVVPVFQGAAEPQTVDDLMNTTGVLVALGLCDGCAAGERWPVAHGITGAGTDDNGGHRG